MLVLGIGLVVLAALLVAVAVDASRLFLARQSLSALADAAALGAAQHVDLASLYQHGADASLAPAQSGAATDVAAYVRRNAAQAERAGLSLLRVKSVSVRGETVVVTLTGVVRLPLVATAVGRPGGVPVTVTAAARTQVG